MNGSRPPRGSAITASLAVLAASLLLGLLGGTALSSELPPENTALPTISPTTPHVSALLLASKGSWTGAPTSYTYAWNRCATKCEAIAGATESSYTVVAADLGKTLTVSVTAKNGAGSTTATSKETSKVKERLSWHTCIFSGWASGVYEDSNCSKKGASNPYKWYRPNSTGASTTNTVKGEIYPYYLNYTTSGGIHFEIYCKNVEGTGTFKNYEEYAGLDNYNSTASQCQVLKPVMGCKLSEEKMVFNTLTARSPESPAELKKELNFEPSSPTPVATFWLEKCSISGFNIQYNLNGSFRTEVQNEGSYMTILGEASKETLNVSTAGGTVLSTARLDGASTLTGVITGGPVKLDTGP